MIVIKIGGGEGIDPRRTAEEIAALWREGQRFVIVHGGSHVTNELSEQLGHPAQFITSPSGHTSRRTDPQTLDIFMMAYCGVVNNRFVEALQAAGVNAVGLSGVDGGLLRGKRKAAIRAVENGRTRVIRDDYTGTVEEVNASLLATLLDQGYLPVVTPPALSYEGEAINVDGDRAAACIAVALKAEQLIFLSNVPGLLRDVTDPESLISDIARHRLEEFDSFAEGRMKKKLLGAQEALDGGVGRVVIGDARGEEAIHGALNGKGTVIG
jgi:acetylglutamate/LysW-gamma-L-alpha-aminoadipate kinase